MKWPMWLCRLGVHHWRWLPGNQIRCTVCGKVERDLP